MVCNIERLVVTDKSEREDLYRGLCKFWDEATDINRTIKDASFLFCQVICSNGFCNAGLAVFRVVSQTSEKNICHVLASCRNLMRNAREFWRFRIICLVLFRWIDHSRLVCPLPSCKTKNHMHCSAVSVYTWFGNIAMSWSHLRMKIFSVCLSEVNIVDFPSRALSSRYEIKIYIHKIASVYSNFLLVVVNRYIFRGRAQSKSDAQTVYLNFRLYFFLESRMFKKC